MCGIVGYIGHRSAAPVILGGLRSLEYRGYDSFGIATLGKNLEVWKKKGKISDAGAVPGNLSGKIGIGHTRWATHGAPSDENAHPHLDCTGTIAVVHNGVIENFLPLRRELEARGHVFTSGTDTEVIVHLIEEQNGADLAVAVELTLKRLEGSYAILAIKAGEDRIVAARRQSPLVIGLGDGEVIAASDMTPLIDYTRSALILEEGDLATITPKGIGVFQGGHPVTRPLREVEWTAEDVRKGGFRHFMEKEIFEAPGVFHAAVKGTTFDEVPLWLRDCTALTLVACGTSYHAGMIFRYLMEEYGRVPVRVDLASEFKYYTPPLSGPVIGISQSGETADTIAALKAAKARNYPTIAVTNVVGSTITRIADFTLMMRAGPEISVAATKSFIAELGVLLALIDMRVGGSLRGHLSGGAQYIETALLADLSDAVALCAPAGHIFFVGRGPFFPAALEGALKMKEISYIHAEGYAAGEIKHGPFALLSPETPVVALCTRGPAYPVMVSNIHEMRARGAPLIVVGDCADLVIEHVADIFIPIPATHPILQVVTASVILQQLAYLTADTLGREIDQPRNLAKSVTVE
ncbi:MAG: glutamine--fructose-6-phosphate transaminase (isomerizing) [Methanomicrobiales archaeon]|nr:glutamine--fructose-6-phosphate transaminase (isomerizing) [Methanomicrobiales archaeon]